MSEYIVELKEENKEQVLKWGSYDYLNHWTIHTIPINGTHIERSGTVIRFFKNGKRIGYYDTDCDKILEESPIKMNRVFELIPEKEMI